MSIFERLLGSRDAEEASDPGARSAPGLPSPQGWWDLDSGWPEGRTRNFRDLFPQPRNAVFELVELGEKLALCRDASMAGGRALEVFGADSRERLESYALATQALNLGQAVVGRYKGTLGHLVVTLEGHLESIPEVAHFKLVASYLRAIGEDLRDGGDEDLGPLGRRLLETLRQVREARRRTTPAPSGVPQGGTTASLAEQFQAAYAPAPAEATEDDEPLPPGDMTAEAVFRALLEECIQDGHFSRGETRAICQIRDLLGISLKRHSEILRLVQADFEAGKFRGDEEMNPLTFFEKCCRLALADGVLEPAEKAILDALARYLHVTRDEWAAIKRRLGKPAAP